MYRKFLLEGAAVTHSGIHRVDDVTVCVDCQMLLLGKPVLYCNACVCLMCMNQLCTHMPITTKASLLQYLHFNANTYSSLVPCELPSTCT